MSFKRPNDNFGGGFGGLNKRGNFGDGFGGILGGGFGSQSPMDNFGGGMSSRGNFGGGMSTRGDFGGGMSSRANFCGGLSKEGNLGEGMIARGNLGGGMIARANLGGGMSTISNFRGGVSTGGNFGEAMSTRENFGGGISSRGNFGGGYDDTVDHFGGGYGGDSEERFVGDAGDSFVGGGVQTTGDNFVGGPGVQHTRANFGGGNGGPSPRGNVDGGLGGWSIRGNYGGGNGGLSTRGNYGADFGGPSGNFRGISVGPSTRDSGGLNSKGNFGRGGGASARGIPFMKSGTRDDGSKADFSGKQYHAPIPLIKDEPPLDIDVDSMLIPEHMMEKREFIEDLCSVLIKKLMDPKNQTVSNMMGQCIQKCGTNPETIYVELKKINRIEFPPQLIQKVPPEGFACEFRAQGIYMGMGFAGSKGGARDRAIDQAVEILKSSEANVVALQRRWGNQNYPEYVLTEHAKPPLPPFISPPEGTMEADHEREKEFEKKELKARNAEEKKGMEIENLSHIGPPITPSKRVEHFVIMERRGENAVCVVNTSSQFCKMAVDWYFELAVANKEDQNDWVCTMFIEGKAVSDARGIKKTLKMKSSENGLKCLKKICHTVFVANNGVKKDSLVSRKEVKGTTENNRFEKTSKIGSENIGNKMMKMMGWTEGEGLGAGDGEAITEPVKVTGESVYRKGFGNNSFSKSINSDNITREEVEDIIRNYANSDDLDDLTFQSEFYFDERMEMKMLAKRYGLCERTALQTEPSGKRKVHLVLSKRLPVEVIIEQLEKDPKWGRYELQKPEGGDRFTLKKFLTHQNARPSSGFPTEDGESKTGMVLSYSQSMDKKKEKREGGNGPVFVFGLKRHGAKRDFESSRGYGNEGGNEGIRPGLRMEAGGGGYGSEFSEEAYENSGGGYGGYSNRGDYGSGGGGYGSGGGGYGNRFHNQGDEFGQQMGGGGTTALNNFFDY